MNLNANIPVIIREDDYQLLKPYFTKTDGSSGDMSLSAELGRAVVVKKHAFPPHVIRINSRVQIVDEENGAAREVCLVLPQHANIRENKISILSPIGAALIGFSKSETVQWQVPAGLKKFRIAEVHNEKD
ncbi:GreA/GreB family elongation factor [Pedobacter deserti]|uniref:GreA/GreB family elongation factor n=1 Tax=Pedobacter deserti TaxID=2817382 RepID=UPI00210C71D6|nr:GreA/GreB family elongation factor [Pedobacter sp. SYSU D00382]